MATGSRIRTPDPLRSDVSIVDKSGRPTAYFQQQWTKVGRINVTIDGVVTDLTALQEDVDALLAFDITTDSPVTGGGTLDDPAGFTAITLENSGATPGTYGDSGNIPTIQVDTFGRVVAISETALPTIPENFTDLDDTPGVISSFKMLIGDATTDPMNPVLKWRDRPYDILIYYPEKPDDNETLVRLRPTRLFSIRQPTGARAEAAVAADATTNFKIEKNGVQFGTVSFAASASTGTFSWTGDESFDLGDLFSITLDGTADADLADISISIPGVRDNLG
jgi:hypothetical protein